MNKTIKVLVNGNPYEVEVGDLSVSPIQVVVNGTAYEVKLETESAPAAAPAAAKPVSAPKPAPAAVPVKAAVAATGSENEVVAPMPGVILDIAVKPGSKVTSGTLLCYLEAMKMKNAIRASRDGVIASVEVTDGQRVQYGNVLFKYE